MSNMRSSHLVEMRRALHNQSLESTRQHHTGAEWLARGQAMVARDHALLELRELQSSYCELDIKVCCCT